MTNASEFFISVDIEASGPVPGEYSMLSIGACVVLAPEQTFSCELKPISDKFDPDAMAVLGRTVEDYGKSGLDPAAAMHAFSEWVGNLHQANETVVFVGFNAPFDWSFVNYYFHRFLGRNPFGFTALDIKAYYMGATGCQWQDTRSSRIAERLRPELSGTHDPLDDALYQAELFRLTRDKIIDARGKGK